MSDRYRHLTGHHVDFQPEIADIVGLHTAYCWGCGPRAVDGLGLVPRLDGSTVVTDLEFAPRFEGGPGVIHGGAIAAFMDDLLGYLPVVYGSPGVTARLETNYVRPIPLGVTVRGSAWLSKVDGTKMWGEGTIEAEGKVLVEASALFLAIGVEHFQKVFEGLTDEQLERNAAYRSGENYP